MVTFIIKFTLLVITTFLMIYFLEKDYKINGIKKVITNSKYSRIAFFLGIANVLLVSGLLDVIHQKYLYSLLNDKMNIIVEWVIIPLISLLMYIAIFISTYSQIRTKKELGIKDKLISQKAHNKGS